MLRGTGEMMKRFEGEWLLELPLELLLESILRAMAAQTTFLLS